jgi:YVTN family beta-propeller protein
MAQQVVLSQSSWRRRIAFLLLAFAAILFVGSLALYVVSYVVVPASNPLEKLADAPLPGGLPSFDQQALDPQTKLLFIAHSGGSEVVVFDTNAQRVVTQIKGIKKNHGIVVIPELNRAYVSETFDNQVYVIDEKTYRVLARVPVGQKPDTMAYDPTDHRLFVSNETGQSSTVIDVRTNRAVATVPLGGDAGNIRYDSVLHRIFVSLETLNQVVGIDPVSLRIIERGSLPTTCKHNHGLVLDVAQHLGMVECDVSATLYLLDTQSMRVLATQSVGAEPDIMAFDDGRHLLYVSSHSGFLSVFDDSGKTLKKVYEQCIASNAHSVFVDQATHRIYLPVVSQPTNVCAVPTPAPSPSPNVTVTANAAGPSVLRIMLFHYGGI